jgi:hypothetical protein
MVGFDENVFSMPEDFDIQRAKSKSQKESRFLPRLSGFFTNIFSKEQPS